MTKTIIIQIKNPWKHLKPHKITDFESIILNMHVWKRLYNNDDNDNNLFDHILQVI